MAKYLALLRGINVGGHNKLAMSDLRQLAAGLGHGDVVTYIQSGNLIFSSALSDPEPLADELEVQLASQLSVRAPVVVISARELRQVIAANPFPDVTDPKGLHAVFRRHDLDAAGHAAVSAAVRKARQAGSLDDAVVVGRTLYLRTPGGLGRSDLAAELGRSAAQAAGTARNWATVTRLMAMLAGD